MLNKKTLRRKDDLGISARSNIHCEEEEEKENLFNSGNVAVSCSESADSPEENPPNKCGYEPK